MLNFNTKATTHGTCLHPPFLFLSASTLVMMLVLSMVVESRYKLCMGELIFLTHESFHIMNSKIHKH